MPTTPNAPPRERTMLTCAAPLTVRPRAAAADTPAAPEERAVDVVASTAVLDRHGEMIEQSWRLERYGANPVVLYAHDSWALPIGTAENVRVEEGALRATLRFVSAEANPKAEQVWRLIQEKALRSVSVGFWPHGARVERRARAEGEPDEEILVLSDNELLEISVVPVPANPEALVELRQRALTTSPTRAARSQETRPMAVEKKELSPEEQAKIDFADKVMAMCMELMGGESGQMPMEPEKALGTVRGLVAGRKAAESALRELATVRAEREGERREKLLASARAEGRLTPGIEGSESWKALAAGPTATLEAALSVLPRAAPTERVHPAVPSESTDTLTPDEERYARAAGITREDLLAQKKRDASRRPTTSQE